MRSARLATVSLSRLMQPLRSDSAEVEVEKSLEALRERLATIYDLDRAAGVLEWDQQTYMPPGGAEARAEQQATLAQIGHELQTDPRTGELLALAAREVEAAPADSVDRNL